MTALIPHDLDVEILKERPDSAPFRIDNDSAADWAVTRLADLRSKAEALELMASQEIERIKTWRDDELKSLLSRNAFFTLLLEDYARRQRNDVDRKSISVPHGKISTRFTQPKFEIADEIFMPWALEHAPQLVRVKQEASVSAMREHLVIDGTKLIDPQTGAIVEGVVATLPELSITIKINEEE